MIIHDETIQEIFERYQVESNIIPENLDKSENLMGISYDLYNRSERQYMKAGRFLTKYTVLPESVIAPMTREINEYLSALRNAIKVVVNKDFYHAYDYCNYAPSDSGNLGCSCMREYPSEMEDFYSSIPCLSIASEISHDGKVHSRALLWNTPDGIYLDRTYSINDQYQLPVEHDLSYDNGSANSLLIPTNFKFQTHFRSYDDTFVPYIDTFYYLLCDSEGRIFLSGNEYHDGLFLVGFARSTHGYLDDYNESLEFNGHEIIDNTKHCNECGERIYNDDYYYINDDYYCGNCSCYSDYHNEQLVLSEAKYVCGIGYVREDETVIDINGDYILKDEAVLFEDNYYHEDRMIETFDLLTVPKSQVCSIDGKYYWIKSDGIIFAEGVYKFAMEQLTLKFA